MQKMNASNTNSALSFDDIQNVRKGTDAFEVYKFPGTEVDIGIRVLSQHEIIIARDSGKKKAHTELEHKDAEALTEYELRELLQKAVICVPAESGSLADPFFKSAEEIGRLTKDEEYLIVEHYLEVQEKYSPVQLLKTEQDFTDWVEKLKKKPALGTSLSTHTLRELLLFSISDTATLQKDSGTGSSPSNQEKETLKSKGIRKGITIQSKENSPIQNSETN